MPKKLTTYKRPPIVEQIGTAPNIQALGVMRAALMLGIARGTLDPSPKTLAGWEMALWTRVLNFISEAKRGDEACFIYNFVLSWSRPPGIEELIQAVFKKTVRDLPSDAELLKRRGILIQGVTT